MFNIPTLTTYLRHHSTAGATGPVAPAEVTAATDERGSLSPRAASAERVATVWAFSPRPPKSVKQGLSANAVRLGRVVREHAVPILVSTSMAALSAEIAAAAFRTGRPALALIPAAWCLAAADLGTRCVKDEWNREKKREVNAR